jgi:hypothetical protein
MIRTTVKATSPANMSDLYTSGHFMRINTDISLFTDVEFETYAWDKFFMAPIDAGCLAFIVQTSDVKFMVQTFARLAHSPRSIYRASRKYLFVPSRYIEDTIFETGVKEVFSIRETDFMPDLVIAKFVAERSLVSGYSTRVLPIPGE